VPLASAFQFRPSLPYYSTQGIALVLTDASGQEYHLPTDGSLTRNESFIITLEKSQIRSAVSPKKTQDSRWEPRMTHAYEWSSRRLFFFLLAAFACLLFPRRYAESLHGLLPAVLLLFLGVSSACLQIPFSFLPADILVRPQEIFLISLLYPALAVLTMYLAYRKIREGAPTATGKTPSPVKFFIVAAAIFGGLLAFIMPPFQVADEAAHFFKAYQVSEGNLSSKQVPPSLYRLRDLFDYLPFHPERKTSVDQILSSRGIQLNPEEMGVAPTLNYSPIPYLPAASGIFVGRHMEAPPLFLFYIGRTCSLLAYILLVAWAIRLMPVQKWALALFALIPMCMAQAAAITADTVTLALSYLAFAYILHLCWEVPALRYSHWLRLSLLFVLIALTKPVYFVLAFLFLLIPRRKVGPFWKYWGGFIGLVLLSAATAKGWIAFNQKLQTYSAMGASGNQQLSVILQHPIHFLQILLTTFQRYGAGYLEHLVGRLGWLDTGLPNAFRQFYLALLVLVAFLGWNREVDLSWLKRLLIVATILSGVSLIAIFLFLSWTPIGSPTVEGIQGRYFLPFVPPFLLLLLYPRRNPSTAAKEFPPLPLAWSAVALATATTLGSVVVRYYLPI